MSEAAQQKRAFGADLVYKYAILFVVASIVILPLLATVLGGFKSLSELRTNTFGLPRAWDAEAYVSILTGSKFWVYLWNSLKIALLAVTLTVGLAAMAGFVFAMIHFSGREALLAYFTIGLMFPLATAALPLFIKVRDLGLLDSHWGVVLPKIAFGLALSIILFRRFFKEIPQELAEAAYVDGCSHARFFWSIVLPLSKPILATVATIQFVQTWNNYILPLVLLNTEEKYPWPLGIMQFQGEYLQEWNMILAFITLTMIPTVAFFMLCQKHIIAGLTSGSVKG
jgi:raffinose/stachyose/melibiose transport system permease protein